MLGESNFQERVQIILYRWILYCPMAKRVPPWNHAAALAPRFGFVFSKYDFFPSFCLLLTTAKRSASLNSRCGTCSFTVCFCFGEGRRFPFVFFRFAHSWPRLKVRLERDCNIVLLSREAQVCTLWTPGVLLFHWLAAFQVATFLCEGVICL